MDNDFTDLFNYLVNIFIFHY